MVQKDRRGDRMTLKEIGRKIAQTLKEIGRKAARVLRLVKTADEKVASSIATSLDTIAERARKYEKNIRSEDEYQKKIGGKAAGEKI